MDQYDLLSQLQSEFHSFSKSQKLIARYILDNYDRAAFITASRMGRTVNVSESTVVRFAYSLGYDGYPALQRALQELIRNKLTAVQRIQLSSTSIRQSEVLDTVLKADIQNIRATIDSADNTAFEGAVNALLEAPHIYIVGMRSAFPIAQFLAYYLGFICTGTVSINSMLNNACEQMAHITPGEVCVAISFPRYSRSTLEALQFARKAGATTVVLTDSAASPLIPYADFALTAQSNMASFADSLVAPLSLINAIIVSAGLRRKEYLMGHFSKLEAIWGLQDVYIKDAAHTVEFTPKMEDA